VWVAFALARLDADPEPHVAELIELWKDEPAGPRGDLSMTWYGVAEALAELGPAARPARDLLLDALATGKLSPGTAGYAVRALGRMPEDADVTAPRLIAFLGKPAEGYAWASTAADVADCLGSFGPKAKQAVPALRVLAAHEDDRLGRAALAALRRIEGKPATPR
jgi:hypothetical protein